MLKELIKYSAKVFRTIDKLDSSNKDVLDIIRSKWSELKIDILWNMNESISKNKIKIVLFKRLL